MRFQKDAAKELRDRTKDLNIRVVSGMDGLLEVAVQPESEILVTAIVGMLGIRPTIAAIEAGKRLHLRTRGDACDGRSYHYAAGKNAACRFCRSTASTVLFSSRCKGETGTALRRFFSRRPADRSAGKSRKIWRTFRWGCAASSELDNGTQDHDRFVNACQ